MIAHTKAVTNVTDAIIVKSKDLEMLSGQTIPVRGHTGCDPAGEVVLEEISLQVQTGQEAEGHPIMEQSMVKVMGQAVPDVCMGSIQYIVI